MRDGFKKTFQKAIENHLLSICSNQETLHRTNSIVYEQTKCIFYTVSGIKSININPDTYIGVEYFDNPSFFKESDIVNRYSGNQKVVVFLNIDNKKQHKTEHGNRLRFIYLDDLNQNVRQRPNERFAKGAYRKSKCVNADRLYEYVKFIFRIKLLHAFFPNETITPYIFGNDLANKTYNDVFPFRYERYGINYIFFEYKDSLKTYFQEYLDSNEGKVVFEQVSVRKDNKLNNESCFLTITEKNKILFDETNRGFVERKHIRVDKVFNGDLTKFVGLFDQGGEYEVDDFHQIYKYRQFAKSRYDTAEESVKYNSNPTLYSDSYEICVGSRNAIEKNQIWFSTYKYLNDPFDLVIRTPSLITSRKTPIDIEMDATNYNVITDSGFAVFCSTTDSKNILMWAHYADSGKGMCTMYYQNELLYSVSNDNSIELCLYGRVLYSPFRPNFSITSSMLRFFSFDFLTLVFNIANLFSKFIDWHYEEERRFIIFPRQFDPKSFVGHAVDLPAKDFVFGIEFPLKDFSNYLSITGVTYKSFTLSDDDYKLI